ncbi:MAG: hypothetical protein U0X75_15035 [Acidobacteriota bacterium]
MASERVITLDNSAGLLLPLELLQQIGVNNGDQIEIRVEGHKLTVRPLAEADLENSSLPSTQPTNDKAIDEMMESIMDRHDNLFRRLAEGAK